MSFHIPKGLFDILPYGTADTWKCSHIWQHIEKVIEEITLDYGFKEIRTPIFERTEVFTRSVGETSDIVKKEMYTFLDKAKRSMSLRPEGTACIARAFLENNLFTDSSTHKFYYVGPMFRYDRPQAGRYRQHHQFGIEIIGNSCYEQDAEVIDLLWEFYKRLGLKDLTLNINSVGDVVSRDNYKKALKKYLTPHFEGLSEDSKNRFEKNTLRILDSKEKKDQKILKEAPHILDFLNEESKKMFKDLCATLDFLKIPYVINHNLVRGLDYYNHMVFEITSKKEGSQNSLGGGGRYDGLIKSFNGPDLPAVGFGTGIERIIQTMLEQQITIEETGNPFFYFIPLNEEAKKICFHLTTQLRHLHIPTDMLLRAKKLQKSLKIANKQKAKYCIIIGEEELSEKTILIKDMTDRTQRSSSLAGAIDCLKNIYLKKEKNV